MKTLIIFVLFIVSSFAFAAKSCNQVSASFVKKAYSEYFELEPEYKTQRKIEKVLCEKLQNNILCEVTSSNGDGSGDFVVEVLLNSDCNKVLKSEITEEE